MTLSAMLPLLVLGSSLVPGLVIFGLPDRSRMLRSALNIGGAVFKLVLVTWMIWKAAGGEYFEFRVALLPGMDFMLRSGPLALFFVGLSALLWLVTTIYAVGYLEDSPHRSRFFGFFSICVTATVGAALAGNLLTFLIFYEMLTLSTYPLIVHRETDEARRAGRVLSRLHARRRHTCHDRGRLAVHRYGHAGVCSTAASWHHSSMPKRGPWVLIFVVLVAGMGVKAALVPLHGWLPRAMIAPVPVSALLHAVAVVKIGAFGLMRIVFSIYGIDVATTLGLAQGLAAVAAFTILYGSVRALAQSNLKRLLAYSTVSQLSFIALGITLGSPLAAVGGIVHLVHQGMMKITLFFAAGNLAETLGIHEIRDMRGVGRRMPWTMAAFTLCAFGMIGVPPTAGFVTKWTIGLGAMDAGATWAIWLLVASSVLNALYFLADTSQRLVRGASRQLAAERHFGRASRPRSCCCCRHCSRQPWRWPSACSHRRPTARSSGHAWSRRGSTGHDGAV